MECSHYTNLTAITAAFFVPSFLFQPNIIYLLPKYKHHEFKKLWSDYEGKNA